MTNSIMAFWKRFRNPFHNVTDNKIYTEIKKAVKSTLIGPNLCAIGCRNSYLRHILIIKNP